jgi:hypothetical protein
LSGSINLPVQHMMVAYLKTALLAANLTQQQVASARGRYQSFVATVELRQRRVDVVEFIEFANVIGFDAADAITKLQSALMTATRALSLISDVRAIPGKNSGAMACFCSCPLSCLRVLRLAAVLLHWSYQPS